MIITTGEADEEEQRVWGVFQGDPRRTGALASRVLPPNRLRPGEREPARTGPPPPSEEPEGTDLVREGASAEAQIPRVGPVHDPREAPCRTAPRPRPQELGDCTAPRRLGRNAGGAEPPAAARPPPHPCYGHGIGPSPGSRRRTDSASRLGRARGCLR